MMAADRLHAEAKMIGVQDHCEMQSQTFILATTLPIHSDHEASSRYTQTVWRPPSASWRTTRSSTTPHPELTKLKDEDYPGAVVLGLRHQPQLHRTNPTTQSTETCPECNGNLSGGGVPWPSDEPGRGSGWHGLETFLATTRTTWQHITSCRSHPIKAHFTIDYQNFLDAYIELFRTLDVCLDFRFSAFSFSSSSPSSSCSSCSSSLDDSSKISVKLSADLIGSNDYN